MPRGPALATVVAVLCLAGPGATQAASVSLSGGMLQVTDFSGEDNNLTVSMAGSTASVTDAVNPLTAGSFCTQMGPNTVECADATGANLMVMLGDGANTVHAEGWPSCSSEGCAFAGGSGTDTIHGTAAEDDISGGEGNDLLYGGGGNDLALRGDDGNDTLDGESGNDYLIGGPGADLFTDSGGGMDTVWYAGIVEQGGLARSTLPVARYKAPSSRLAAPRVRAVRRGGSAAVTWTPVSRASGYRVTAKLNGRTAYVSTAANRRRAMIAGLLPSAGATMVVEAIGPGNVFGSAGRAVVRLPKVRKRGR